MPVLTGRAKKANFNWRRAGTFGPTAKYVTAERRCGPAIPYAHNPRALPRESGSPDLRPCSSMTRASIISAGLRLGRRTRAMSASLAIGGIDIVSRLVRSPSASTQAREGFAGDTERLGLSASGPGDCSAASNITRARHLVAAVEEHSVLWSILECRRPGADARSTTCPAGGRSCGQERQLFAAAVA